MLKITHVCSKTCHKGFYQRTGVINPHFPCRSLQQGDNVPQGTDPLAPQRHSC